MKQCYLIVLQVRLSFPQLLHEVAPLLVMSYPVLDLVAQQSAWDLFHTAANKSSVYSGPPLDPEVESSKSWIFVQICSKNNTNFDCRSAEFKNFRLRRADSNFSIQNLSKSLIFKNQGGLGPPWI